MQRIRYSRYLKSIVVLLDLLVIASVFVFFFLDKNYDLLFDRDTWSQNSFPILLLISFWILLSGRTKIYNITRNLTYTVFLERIITHFLLFIIGLVLIRKVSNNQFFASELTLLAVYFFFFIIYKKQIVSFSKC